MCLIRLKLLKKPLLIVLLTLSFNTHADIIQEAQAFLIGINHNQGFWFSTLPSSASEPESAILKACQSQTSKDLTTIADRKALFTRLKQQTQFVDHHALLFFTEGDEAREQSIHQFAEQYALPLICVTKNQGEFRLKDENDTSLQNAFLRLNSDVEAVFLLHSKKRQVTLLSRTHDLCVLEQALFLALYKQLNNQEEG